MSELRYKNNMEIIEEHESSSIMANLICDCGNRTFNIFHTGKQTKGIFSANIIKKNKQILIEAYCAKCGKKITILDTKIDGLNPKEIVHEQPILFMYKNDKLFNIRIGLNYLKEDYMTNRFYDCYIYLSNDNIKKIVLFE